MKSGEMQFEPNRKRNAFQGLQWEQNKNINDGNAATRFEPLEAEMFEVTLVVVPPGGGEAEYSLRMRVPALPREGDYVTVIRDREGAVAGIDIGTEDFIVRRVWWAFRYPDDGTLYHEAGEDPVGEVSGTVSIECEMAKGHYSCERHVRACGPRAETFEASAY